MGIAWVHHDFGVFLAFDGEIVQFHEREHAAIELIIAGGSAELRQLAVVIVFLYPHQVAFVAHSGVFEHFREVERGVLGNCDHAVAGQCFHELFLVLDFYLGHRLYHFGLRGDAAHGNEHAGECEDDFFHIAIVCYGLIMMSKIDFYKIRQ